MRMVMENAFSLTQRKIFSTSCLVVNSSVFLAIGNEVKAFSKNRGTQPTQFAVYLTPHENTESRKNLEQKFIFQPGILCSYRVNERPHPLIGFIFPPMAKLRHSLINFSIRPVEGLTLEASAFQIFHGGNSTFINSFDKIKFLSHSPPDAVQQFL